MKSLFTIILTLVCTAVVGQTWYSVDCSEIPPMDTWCYNGGLAADISPVAEPHLFLVDTTDQSNSWQFGETSKAFGFANVPNSGWVTDSANSYGLGLNSEFVVLVTAENWGVTWISFEHSWDTDSLRDGGRISFSCDGLNWENVSPNSWGFPPELLGTNNYSEYFVHDSVPTFTGNSHSWITSSIGLQWYIPVFQGEQNSKTSSSGCELSNMDTAFFKFSFTSDSIETNQDGWIIRNITVGTHGLPSSISENHHLPLAIYPNPSSDFVQIQLPSGQQRGRETRIYDVMGKLVYSNPFKPELDISFLNTGSYLVVVTTENGHFRSMLQRR